VSNLLRATEYSPMLALSAAMYQDPRGQLIEGVNSAMTQERSSEQLWGEASALFARWRDGDRAAMDDLVRVLSPVLWQIARAQRLDEEAAADVVQTAWLQLVRRPDAVRDPGAVGAWLTTTTRREAWRVVKASGRVDPVADDLPTPPVRSAEEEATTRLRDRALWQAVGQLSERCQRLLRVAAFLDRPNYAQLAEDLGMAIGSIGPTRARCLTKLRALIDPEEVRRA
jgi:RNA polymerase sigma factor (sigma-70 family)